MTDEKLTDQQEKALLDAMKCESIFYTTPWAVVQVVEPPQVEVTTDRDIVFRPHSSKAVMVPVKKLTALISGRKVEAVVATGKHKGVLYVRISSYPSKDTVWPMLNIFY